MGITAPAKPRFVNEPLVGALDLAPAVRSNAVAPGAILSADWEESAFEATVARLPLQRSGAPEDVAAAVRYLLEAPYVTGQVLAVDGGWGLI